MSKEIRTTMTNMKMLLLVVMSCCVGSSTGSTNFREKRSDDTTIAALEAIVQQQGAQIQTLQAKLTALEYRLPSTFTPVAFTVGFSHDDQDKGIAMGPLQILKFDNVLTNMGAGYDETTGIFTAPVSGTYGFYLSVMAPNAHGYTRISIVKAGSILNGVFGEGKTDIYDQGSTQVTTHLQSGQKVWVQQYEGDAVRGSWYTIFTGFMIQAD
ncbi:complement C1q-like protein 3 [Pomacea canaliculata]|uniref:complement C1q-like protein 3 n=1 Tax=Pomacea canaliculata TaxID=400727 RepID=UPI000D7377C2|nr:complement C1q-like protein 3 [Pomacea canaliculata]